MGRRDMFHWPPVGAPASVQSDDNWRNFESSVDAVSFGFVATAILISMFFFMAIFERYLRPNSPAGGRSNNADSEMGFNGKQSPKMTVYANGVSVLMPGDDIPTFIAQPAPKACASDRVSLPQQQQQPSCSTSSLDMSS